MEVIPLLSPIYEENTYIIKFSDNNAVLIDPGANKKDIEKILNENKLVLKYIFLTHGHYDHIRSVNYFNKKIIFAHKEEEVILKKPENNLSIFTGKNIAVNDINYFSGNYLKFDNNYKIEIYHTPGHTPGSIIIKINDIIFSGDTLFLDTVGRTDFPYGNSKKLYESLKIFKNFDKKTIIYPGHFDKFYLEDAYKINYFLK